MTTEPAQPARTEQDWSEGIRARLVLDDLRVYLGKYNLSPSQESPTAEAVRDRVITLLDDYRRLAAQQGGKYTVLYGGLYGPCASTGIYGFPYAGTPVSIVKT